MKIVKYKLFNHPNFLDELWWKYMPGDIIRVKWPSGKIVVDHNDPRWIDLGGAVWVEFDSADPNDHYRPWLEKYIGRQGWDWNWAIKNYDASENSITLKIRRKHNKYVPIILLKWS